MRDRRLLNHDFVLILLLLLLVVGLCGAEETAAKAVGSGDPPFASPAPAPPVIPVEGNIYGEISPSVAATWHNDRVETIMATPVDTDVNLPEKIVAEEGGKSEEEVVISESGSVVVRGGGVEEEEVFVPLKEWKQKKLEDIEERVRIIEGREVKREIGGDKKKERRRGRIRSRRNISEGVNGVCWIASPRGLGVLAFRREGWMYREPGTEGGFILAEEGGIVDSWEDDDDKLVGGGLDGEGVGISQNEDEIISEGVDEVNLTQLYGPVEELKLEAIREKRRVGGVPNNSLMAVMQKGASSPMGALMSIPMVGDIMRSIKEVSNVLASSPESLMDSGVVNESESTNVTGKSKERLKLRKAAIRKSKGNEEEKRRSRKGAVNMHSKEEQKMRDESVRDKPFNYASADAGARILAVSEGVMGAKNVIEGSVDKYSLAPCDGEGIGGSRWIDVELSEDIILESVEIGNLEYYSSSARRVAILGASGYPPGKWKILGVFEFADVKKLQRFEIKDRLVTTRYLRVMFGGKQGHEFYCPISAVHAYGKSLLADWKDAFETPIEVRKLSSQQKNAKKESTMFSKTDLMGRDAKDVVENGNLLRISSGRTGEERGCEGETCKATKNARVNNRTEEEATRAAFAQSNTDVSAELAQDSEDNILGGRNESSAETKRNSTDLAPSASPDLQDMTNSAACSATTDGSDANCEAGSSTETPREELAAESMSEDDKKVLEAVRAEVLSAVSDNDNIFRKVTRLIRLLELNQTLTNQYIDTQLSRFAKALTKSQMETLKAQELATMTEQRMVGGMVMMEGRIRELKADLLKRDIVMCVIVICVAFLVGGQWVMWIALSVVKVHGGEVRKGEVGSVVSEEGGRPPIGKRKKKSGGGSGRVNDGREFGGSGRSISSVELDVVAKGGGRRRLSLQNVGAVL